jgi:phage-related protein
MNLMSPRDKPLVWLRGSVKTPPFGPGARVEAGCHELPILDGSTNWRIMYHIAPDAIVILDIFPKKTAATPRRLLAECRTRLAAFQQAVQHRKGARRARR